MGFLPNNTTGFKSASGFSQVSRRDDFGFASSGFEGDVFTKGAPTSQPYVASAASFASACGCGA